MRSLPLQITCALALALLPWLTAPAGQQSAPARQKAPRLTTDDVLRPAAVPPSADAKEAAAKPDGAAVGDAAVSKPSQLKATEVKPDGEETSWRERLAKARNLAKDLERTAEEAELRITALRNDLGTSGQSTRYRNETAAELGQAGQRLTELRAQARAAANDAAQLVQYGGQRGFTEAEGPKATSEEGKPNEEYYHARFGKLNEALEGALRRVQLYDNRVRDLTQQISANSGGKDKNGRGTGGDSFFALQLQKDREEAQQKLDAARGEQTQAQTDLEALREEARRAGVPPGLFR
jgi:hypothetical protein